MKRLGRKLNTKGFSLSELLVTVAIIAVFSVAVASVTKSAVNTYKSTTMITEATSLEDTINTALADTLRYSVAENADGVFTFEEYKGCTLQASAADGKIYMVVPKSKNGQVALLNSGTYGNMTVSDLAVSYTPNVYTVTYTINSGSWTRDCRTYVRILG